MSNISHTWGRILRVTKGRSWKRDPVLTLRIVSTDGDGRPEQLNVSLRGDFAERMAMILEKRMVVVCTGWLSNTTARGSSFEFHVVALKILAQRLPVRAFAQSLKKMQRQMLPSQPPKRKRFAPE